MNPNALKTLRDIHLPAPPAWWAMPEVWAALACTLMGVAWFIYHRLRHRLLHRSLRELAALEAAHALDPDAVHLARGLSQLLRRHAAACFPEAGVEGLTGRDWLDFLDAHGGGSDFTQGAGAVLESLPYQGSGSADTRALIALARRWLRENPR